MNIPIDTVDQENSPEPNDNNNEDEENNKLPEPENQSPPPRQPLERRRDCDSRDEAMTVTGTLTTALILIITIIVTGILLKLQICSYFHQYSGNEDYSQSDSLFPPPEFSILSSLDLTTLITPPQESSSATAGIEKHIILVKSWLLLGLKKLRSDEDESLVREKECLLSSVNEKYEINLHKYPCS